MKKIQWNKVTWYSKLIAVILFVAVYLCAFYFGEQFQLLKDSVLASASTQSTNPITENIVANARFECASGKSVQAQFTRNTAGQESVALQLSDGRSIILPQAMSADGARFATADESFVFWNVGNGAFIQEQTSSSSKPVMTYSDCVTN